MFRTIIARNEPILQNSIRRVNKLNTIRCLSTQCLRKIQTGRNAQITTFRAQPAVWRVGFFRGYADLPDHTKVLLPALSPTMELGTIVSWEKKEGDKLNEGDLLAEIETDKATMGFETPEEGYLAKILYSAGSKDIPVGKLVCIIVENEDDVAAFKDFKDDGSAASPPKAAAPTPAPPTPAAAPPSPPPPPPSSRPLGAQTASEQKFGDRVLASPMAKRLAEQQKLRLEGRGSGLYGSLTSKDLEGMESAGASAIQAPVIPPGAAYIDIPVSNVRGVIAKRLLESKNTIPHYYLTVDCNVDKILELRARFNKSLEKSGSKLSVNDFIIKAAATACKKVPEVNSAWLGNVIRQFDAVDVSVAVSTENGLITPIVFSADRKGIEDISKDVKSLAAKARDGKLQPQEFQGGTFTVSNLGMFDVTHFCAIINPPQSCILAVGGAQKRLVIDETAEKGFKESTFISVTVSADHRTVDGAVGARWLQYFRKYMEDPATMLL
ncbi:CLUMA_CG006820, isoform A [Clunio marinus]|uniref:dihydrolipoyllysine-residue acetyltransferase n=1 Tax=Clunio marinus TaxID=568069 RepID=A0A1J1HZ22_9DIPT|nr:CLUMA_CG006820, isoform A [Clunio marinus]